MKPIFNCIEDDICPDEIRAAGERGELQVQIEPWFWIDLSKEDFSEVRNGLTYRVNPQFCMEG
jgi:hypothetical protein